MIVNSTDLKFFETIFWCLRNIQYEIRAIGHIIRNMDSVSEVKRLKLLCICVARVVFLQSVLICLSNILRPNKQKYELMVLY